MAFLEVRDLRSRYGEIEALHGVAFDVERGAIVAVLGANGAGKTTSLRAICGAVKTSGTVVLDGTSLVGRPPEEVARLRVAFVPEGRGTLYQLSVWENLMLGAYTLNAKRAQEQYERVLGYFPWIEERKHQIAGTLSGGEQQMLAIGRALMMDPQLILLDEPSLGLAPLVVREIFALLQKINREDRVTILFAEQNAGIALETAAHAYVLETGRVTAAGPSSELARNEQIRTSYLGY